jgi:hypothetical protein
VKEESQIEHMRAALKGDRERAERARQRSTENVRALVQPAVREPTPMTAPTPEPAPSLLRRLFGR